MATWRVQKDDYGNLRILSTSNLDHFWPHTVFESEVYGECLEYVRRAERKQQYLQTIGTGLIFMGGVGSLLFGIWLLAGFFA